MQPLSGSDGPTLTFPIVGSGSLVVGHPDSVVSIGLVGALGGAHLLSGLSVVPLVIRGLLLGAGVGTDGVF